MVKFVLLFGLTLSVSCFWSQKGTLEGMVVDANNVAIEGANVICKRDISLGVQSDATGHFKIELPIGNNVLLVRASGMRSDTLKLEISENETTTVNVKMQPYSISKDQVTVSVGKFDKPLEEQTVTMVILKPELIENKNTRSIESALDQTPGLNILDGEPQIRGGSGFTFGVGAKVAVLVDDVPMLSGDAGRPEWGFIPVENISQVEVIKGAASVLSGSSALSGSIHIRTAYPTSKPLTKFNFYTGLYSAPSVPDSKWWSDVPVISGVNFIHTKAYGNLDVVLGGNLNYDHGYIGAPKPGPYVIDTVSNFSNKQMAMKRVRFNYNLRYRSKKISGLSYGVNGNAMVSHSNMSFAWLDDSAGLYRAYPGAVFLQKQLIFNIKQYLLLRTNNIYQFTVNYIHLFSFLF